ncbi:MAG: hypothetical protein ACRDC4_13075, partial [Plesiomonas sp.]
AWSRWVQLYTEEYMPSAQEIGAIAANGGTSTGTLHLGAPSEKKMTISDTNKYLGVTANDLTIANKTAGGKIILDSSISPMIRVNNKLGTIYHTENKPTLTELGAVATSDTEDSGEKLMRVNGPRDKAIQAALADATGGAYMAETPPDNPIPGARWFDTNDGRTYLYYVDADSSQWIEENPQSPDIVQASPMLQRLANDKRLDADVKVAGDYAFYHEGNKPTLAELNAFSASGGAVGGAISIAAPQGLNCIDLLQTPVPSGANALGVAGFDSNGVNRTFGTGLFYQDGTIHYAYLGSGPSPWTNLRVYPSNIAYLGDHLIHSTGNTGPVNASAVFNANAATGWICHDHEIVAIRHPWGLTFKGIIRRNPGVPVGDSSIGWFSHPRCKMPYSVHMLSAATVTAPSGMAYTEYMPGSGNVVSGGGWDANTGWMMVDWVVQYE